MTSRAILLSIRPEYVTLMKAGTKTYELRRKRPKIENGYLALVYECSPTKSMVGAFIVGNIISMHPKKLWEKIGTQSGVSMAEFYHYYEGCNKACAIKVAKYWSLDRRIGLSQLRSRVKIEPPQSYRYLCEKKTNMIVGKR